MTALTTINPSHTIIDLKTIDDTSGTKIGSIETKIPLTRLITDLITTENSIETRNNLIETINNTIEMKSNSIETISSLIEMISSSKETISNSIETISSIIEVKNDLIEVINLMGGVRNVSTNPITNSTRIIINLNLKTINGAPVIGTITRRSLIKTKLKVLVVGKRTSSTKMVGKIKVIGQRIVLEIAKISPGTKGN